MASGFGEFERYARVYDALYQDKDYAGEALFIKNLLDAHAVGATKTVAEFGAGSGKLAAELIDLGFEMDCVDLSPQMAIQAKRVPNRPTINVGDIRNFSFGKKFDAVVSFFHVMSYLTSIEDLRMAFRNVSSHLRHGGLFIFDFWFDEAVAATPPEVRVKRVSADGLEIVRFAEPEVAEGELGVVAVKYTLFVRDDDSAPMWTDFEETHRLVPLGLEFLDSLAEEAGLSRVAAVPTLGEGEPTSEDWGVTCAFVKVVAD